MSQNDTKSFHPLDVEGEIIGQVTTTITPPRQIELLVEEQQTKVETGLETPSLGISLAKTDDRAIDALPTTLPNQTKESPIEQHQLPVHKGAPLPPPQIVSSPTNQSAPPPPPPSQAPSVFSFDHLFQDVSKSISSVASQAAAVIKEAASDRIATPPTAFLSRAPSSSSSNPTATLISSLPTTQKSSIKEVTNAGAVMSSLWSTSLFPVKSPLSTTADGIASETNPSLAPLPAPEATKDYTPGYSVSDLTPERVSTLLQYELKFVDLAKAFKVLQKKNIHLERTLKNQQSEANTTTAQYQSQLVTLQEQSSATHLRLQKRDNEIAELQSAMADAKKAFTESQETHFTMISDLQQKLLSKEDENQKFRKTLSKSSSAVLFSANMDGTDVAIQTSTSPDIIPHEDHEKLLRKFEALESSYKTCVESSESDRAQLASALESCREQSREEIRSLTSRIEQLMAENSSLVSSSLIPLVENQNTEAKKDAATLTQSNSHHDTTAVSEPLAARIDPSDQHVTVISSPSENLTGTLISDTIFSQEYVDTLNQKITEVKTANDDISSQLRNSERLLSERQSQLDSTIVDFNRKLDSVNAYAEDQVKNLQQTHMELSASLSRLKSTDADLLQVKRILNEKDKEISRIQLEFQTARQELEGKYESSLDRIDSLMNKIGPLDDQILALMDEIMQLKDGKAEADKTILQLQSLLAEERDGKSKAVQLLRNSKSKISSLEKDLDSATGKIVTLERSHQSDLSTISKHVAEINFLKQQLHMQTQDMSNERATFETKLSLLSAESQLQVELQDQITRLNVDLAKSQQFYEQKCIENDALNIKISDLEALVFKASQAEKVDSYLVEEIKAEMAKLTNELSSKNHELTVLQKEVNRLEGQRDQLGKDFGLLSDELRSKSAELELQMLLTQKGAQLELSQRQELEATLANVKVLEDRIRELSQTHAQSLEDLEKSREDLRVREASLKHINKALKEEVRKLSRSDSGLLGNSPIASPTIERRRSSDQRYPLSASGANSDAKPSASKEMSPRDSFFLGQTSAAILQQPDFEYVKNVLFNFLEQKDKRVALHMIEAIDTRARYPPAFQHPGDV